MKKTIIYIVILLIVAGAFSLVFSDMNQPAKNSIAVLIGSNSGSKVHPGFASTNYPTPGNSSRTATRRSAHNQSTPVASTRTIGINTSKRVNGKGLQGHSAVSGLSTNAIAGRAQQTANTNGTGLISGNTYRYSGNSSSTQNRISNNNLTAASSTLTSTSFSATSGGSGTTNRFSAPGATNEEDPFETGGGENPPGAFNDSPVGEGILILLLLSLFYTFVILRNNINKEVS